MSLLDKVMIVTGASSGIGASLAVEALKEGAKVTAVGRNKAKLDQTVKECEKVTGRKPLVVIADVSKEDQAAEIINQTIKEYGKIDVLVNNAGFSSRMDIFDPKAIEDFDKVMGTNIRAVVYLTHLAAPYLKKTKGNIINVSSVAALKTFKNGWSYCTSKAALDHFSRCMAAELAPHGIRVNVLTPGPVQTDLRINSGFSPEQIRQIENTLNEKTLIKRISQPVEMAHVIIFLASDKAAGITGTTFVSDNGMAIS